MIDYLELLRIGALASIGNMVILVVLILMRHQEGKPSPSDKEWRPPR